MRQKYDIKLNSQEIKKEIEQAIQEKQRVIKFSLFFEGKPHAQMYVIKRKVAEKYQQMIIDAISDLNVEQFKHAVEALTYLFVDCRKESQLQLHITHASFRRIPTTLEYLLADIHLASQPYYGQAHDKEQKYLDSKKYQLHLQMLDFLAEKGFADELKRLVTNYSGDNRDDSYLCKIPKVMQEIVNNYDIASENVCVQATNTL